MQIKKGLPAAPRLQRPAPEKGGRPRRLAVRQCGDLS